MSLIRVHQNEIACGRGRLEVGKLVIDPRTGTVVGRLASLNQDQSADVHIDEDRVGEVMTLLRSAHLNERINVGDRQRVVQKALVRMNSVLMQNSTQKAWHACITHDGVGYVGSALDPMAAYEALAKQCVLALGAEVKMVAAGGQGFTGFEIQVRNIAHDSRGLGKFSFKASIAGSWDGWTGTADTVAEAVEILKRGAVGWTFNGQINAVDEVTQRFVIQPSVKAIVRHVPNLAANASNVFMARWDTAFREHREIIGNGATEWSAVSQLKRICTDLDIITPTSPTWEVRPTNGEEYVILQSEVSPGGDWRTQVRDWDGEPFVIVNPARTGGVADLRERFPNHRFAATPIFTRAQARPLPLASGTMPNPSGASPSYYLSSEDLAAALDIAQVHRGPVAVKPAGKGPARNRRVVDI